MNIWNEDLMCFWLKIEPLHEKTIGIYLPEGSSADMGGAVKTARAVMPKVNKIVVYAGGLRDIDYELRNSKWQVVY